MASRDPDAPLYLNSQQCNAAVKALRSHTVSRIWIVVGYIFFALVIPAVLAYQASKNNEQLATQIQKLAELSLKLRELQKTEPKAILRNLIERAEVLNVQLAALRSKAKSVVGEEAQLKHALELSKIESEALDMLTKIKSMVDAHHELKAYIPVHILPQLLDADAIEAQASVASLAIAAQGAMAPDSALLGEMSDEASIKEVLLAERTPLSIEEKARAGGESIVAPVLASAGMATDAAGVLVAGTMASKVALGDEAKAAAIRTRDEGIRVAQAQLEALATRGVPLGNKGIYNGGNSCYAAAAIQSMRWNPVIRYLVNRDIPDLEFDGNYTIGTEKPSFKKDTEAFALYRKEVQLMLREIFTELDAGRAISAAGINRFRTLLASIGTDETRKWGGIQQQDAQEFQTYLEDLLKKSTIANPISPQDCFVSGLQEEVMMETRVIPDESRLAPAPLGVEGGHAAKGYYVINSKRSCFSMHAVELETVQRGRSCPQVAADFTAAKVKERLGYLEEDVAFLVEHSETGEAAKELRSRVKETEQVPPDVYIRASTGAFIDKQRYERYRIGSAVRGKSILNNPPVFTAYAVRQAINFDNFHSPWRVSGAVPFPESFERPDVEGRDFSAKVTYDITSCLCHSGEATLLGGHYLSYVKIKGEWYQFNDSIVSKAPEFNPMTNPDVYVVQYTKRVPGIEAVLIA